jgi:hypothetical protein
MLFVKLCFIKLDSFQFTPTCHVACPNSQGCNDHNNIVWRLRNPSSLTILENALRYKNFPRCDSTTVQRRPPVRSVAQTARARTPKTAVLGTDTSRAVTISDSTCSYSQHHFVQRADAVSVSGQILLFNGPNWVGFAQRRRQNQFPKRRV